MVDGLGWWGVFVRIYLPLSGHALIGAAMMFFVFQWQAYLWPLLIAPAPHLKVAAVAIAEFFGAVQVELSADLRRRALHLADPDGHPVDLQRYFSVSIASTGGKESPLSCRPARPERSRRPGRRWRAAAARRRGSGGRGRQRLVEGGLGGERRRVVGRGGRRGLARGAAM